MNLTNMTEQNLHYLALCASLEDASELIDSGDTERAKALLERILRQAEEELRQSGT